MTAASQVFDLPELVQDIVNHIYEQASSNQLQSNDRPKLQPLVPLLLVNKTFYRCGIDIIWRSPPHSALLNVQPQQRQMYADRIRQLSINQIDDTLMCGLLRFPRLARLSCCVYAGDAPHDLEHYVAAYLQESLEHLTIIPQARSLEDDRGPHGPQVPPSLAGLQLPRASGIQRFPPLNPTALQPPQGFQLPPGMPHLLPLPNHVDSLGVVGPGMHPNMPGRPTPNSGWQLPPQSFKVDNQLDRRLLYRVLNSCPRIQHLELSHKFACGSSSQFSQHLLHLLRGLKHLRSLRMDCKCLTEDVIVFLITHPGLQVLKGLRFRADKVATAMTCISPAQSFPGLRVLDIHLDQKSIPLLLENVTTLQELRLTDVSPPAFATIGKLTRLTKLTLTVDKQEFGTLADHHFYELQSLSNLRTLSVTPVESHMHGVQDFKQTFFALASGLPRLQELELLLSNVFDGDLLRTIGTECPLLHDLRIKDCRLNQSDLEEGHHPLFRQLKTFDMRTLYLTDRQGDLIWGVRSVGDPINQSTTMFDHIPEYFQSLNETEDRLYESQIIEHSLVTKVLAQSIVENFPNLIRFDVSASSNGAILTRIFEEIKGIAGPEPLDVPRWNTAFGDGDDDEYVPQWKHDERKSG